MLTIPVLRWGKPYESLEVDELSHFITGEPLARIHQANAGILQRDLRKAATARQLLREFQPADLIDRCKRAAELFLKAALPLGDGSQTPDEFARAQSATTGLPVHMCLANMQKNYYVLSHMDQMLDALTRGLDLSILARGYGMESRGVMVSYQAQSPVLGLVLPSNSPGVHTLWLPAVPMQIGLVIKPGQQEPWTPFRMQAAFVQAGLPAECCSIYPGRGQDIGSTILAGCNRAMIFGGQATVERYHGNPGVQVHGPGFSKIVLGDDCVDRWENYLDLMVESAYANGGRSCINISGIWASRHTREIARALAERLGPIPVLPPDDPQAGLAAFTVPGAAQGVWNAIEAGLKEPGVTHMTADHGPRFVELERCGYLRPTVVHCASPAPALAKAEYMFPFVSVVECPQDKMIESMGQTLVCTAITENARWMQSLTDASHIDRLNLGPIPTVKLNWLQPHEGNIVDFLYRARALQVAGQGVAV